MIDYMRTKSVMGTSAREFLSLGQYRVMPNGDVLLVATHVTHPDVGPTEGTLMSGMHLC
jgi:hypothetical protein